MIAPAACPDALPERKECRECLGTFLTRDEEEVLCRACRAKDDNADAAWNAYHEEGVR